MDRIMAFMRRSLRDGTIHMGALSNTAVMEIWATPGNRGRKPGGRPSKTFHQDFNAAVAGQTGRWLFRKHETQDLKFKVQ